MKLTVQQTNAITTYLKRVPVAMRAGAGRLLARCPVLSVTYDEKTDVYLGRMNCPNPCKPQLWIIDGDVQTCCDCNDGYDCIHAVAFGLYLMNSKGALPGRPSSALVAVPTHESRLMELVAEKLGMKVAPEVLSFARVFERQWKAGTRVMDERNLRGVFGIPMSWGSEKIELWPKEVKDPWMAMLACHHVMTELCDELPYVLQEVLALPDKAAVLMLWERERELVRWQESFLKIREHEVRERAEISLEQSPRYRWKLEARMLVLQYATKVGAVFKDVRSTRAGAAIRELRNGGALWHEIHPTAAAALLSAEHHGVAQCQIPLDQRFAKIFRRFVLDPELRGFLVSEEGWPYSLHAGFLVWDLQRVVRGPADESCYALSLVRPESGELVNPEYFLVGEPTLCVGGNEVWQLPAMPWIPPQLKGPWLIPDEALESAAGCKFLHALKLPVPEKLKERVVRIPAHICLAMEISGTVGGMAEYFRVAGMAHFHDHAPEILLVDNMEWQDAGRHSSRYEGLFPQSKKMMLPADALTVMDRTVLGMVSEWLRRLPLRYILVEMVPHHDLRITKALDFPNLFSDWIAERPEGVELILSAELRSLMEGKVAGSVSFNLEATDIDWFDLGVELKVEDLTLSAAEIKLLLKAPGAWVRLGDKGWRKLDLKLSPEQELELAELGIGYDQFSGEKQRMHALQLAGPRASALLPAEQAAEVRRRVEELKLKVTPEVPKAITAQLRPYQEEGFHFLAFLTANRFGGILADDMGLGKTLQTLTWLAWLRKSLPSKHPSLVVCPKSVSDNWRSEAIRFFPSLKVQQWTGEDMGQIGAGKVKPDLLVINFAQLRNYEELLVTQPWQAVVVDEAQNIKNPTSQTARTVCSLRAEYRVALTGTPIENKLMDLWSIMAFAMPGVLGTRAAFSRNFDAKNDGLARRRLGARVRPFLLRRTKKEVAQDLPDRTEEDMMCELEGTQMQLYKAELKRAQGALMKAETSKELDKVRFHILTSLLRLRQICCHPSLVGLMEEPVKPAAARKRAMKEVAVEEKDGGANTSSAKLNALLELLDPLMQEGHKVLVFSQFVSMLELIEAEATGREWRSFMLTGQTDERGKLVEEFQSCAGSAVFLISLKAGGSGLNLTAASYVVLYDPWWNPAVEAQAIDRTHRIGQTQKVIAYRLIAKNTVEEKIRALQKKKGALANDILGEESFAQALTLDDFKFLLGDG